jgi:ketosteroid isomerase-like protein
MASGNVELVRSIYAGWKRGDYSSTDWADPAIEAVSADGPVIGSSKGLAGMADLTRDFLSAWEEYRTEADEYRELDSERVLVLSRFLARSKRSGLELGQIQTKGAALFHIRNDKVINVVRYWNRDRALADLGLKE